MHGLWRVGLMAIIYFGAVAPPPTVRGAEPADPALIPEARGVLDYLESLQGKKILTGISGCQDSQPRAVLHMTGREPAISGDDVSGFHRKWDETYRKVLQGTVDGANRWWHQKGGIVTLHYHWMKPGNPEGSAWVSGGRGTGRLDIAKAVTPGTDEHRAVMEDLKVTADYLKQLSDARVPVLWRPLHEIDGSWFWWTDAEKPENTAALWRLMFDYFVNERELHNLIWVYNAAHVTHGWKRSNDTLEEEVAHRKRFYPGAEYVDIASIDTYANPKLGWGTSWEDARRPAYEMMQQVAPGKMLAIAEDSALLNPDIAQKDGPPWRYCLSWWSGGKSNPVEWMRKTFNHEHMLTLDELPLLVEGNVMPNVRITAPSDGAELCGPDVSLSGFASDRNANLKRVTIHALPAPWRNWFLRSDDAVIEAFPDSTTVGQASLTPDGRWTFTWQNAPTGIYNVVALARDSDGLVACSNVFRVTVGLENLARNNQVTVSSTSKHGDPAEATVDGDPNTMWWSDKDQPDPQWLSVDLGDEKTVGGVSVTWWKAYPEDYTVEVSDDGETWRAVAKTENRRNYQGDMDVFRFEPVRTRYVRLQCRNPAVTWQAYTLFEFGVYEAMPEHD
jgi:mannan endo-1,4-beta-mannosidase